MTSWNYPFKPGQGITWADNTNTWANETRTWTQLIVSIFTSPAKPTTTWTLPNKPT